MIAYTYSEAVEAIRKRDPEIVLYLFRKNFRFIRWQMIRAEIDDYSPQDMFSDIMYSIYVRFDKSDFVLTCDIDTYFMSVFDNQQTFFRYRKNNECREIEQTEISEAEKIAEIPEYETIYDLQKLQALITKHLLKITKACRRIMNLFLLGYKNKEVSGRMKRTDKATKTLKMECRKKLEKSIQEDPEYDAIRNCEETNRKEKK